MQVLTNLSYEKLAEIGIGEGRNSRVYTIRDAQLGASLVAKEIEKKSFKDPAKFFEEARRLYASEHQHVLKIQYAAATADKVCLVMPRAPGGSLLGQIKQAPLSVARSIAVMQEVLSGLAHVHMQRLVHLDVKPSNVLFDALGRALLTDFGQSSPLNAHGVADNVPPLYMEYLPPEVVANGVAVAASDIYQSAFTLLRCLAGDVFASTSSGLALEAEIAAGKYPPRAVPPHVPDRLKRAILRALDVDPGKRFQTATEFSDEIGKVNPALDWSMRSEASGPVWQATRESGVKLVVRRLSTGPGRFNIEIHEVGAKQRACAKPLWAERLTEKSAHACLRKVFKAL